MELSTEQRIKYLTRRTEDYKLINDCLQTADFEKISFIAHKIKGSGSTFGFPELTNIAKGIEISIIELNHSKLIQLLDQFNILIISELQRLRP